MPNNEYKKAGRFLQSENRDLSYLSTKMKTLNALNNKILSFLDPACAKFVNVGNCLGNTLILIVSNAAIATQIRYQIEDLKKKLAADQSLKFIKEIECKVRPAASLHPRLAPSPPVSPIPPLSARTATIVHETAQGIRDEKLRETLQRIADRTIKKEKSEKLK